MLSMVFSTLKAIPSCGIERGEAGFTGSSRFPSKLRSQLTGGSGIITKASCVVLLRLPTVRVIVQLPEVPAITDAGVEGFDINISFGLYAPKGTPKPVLDQLTGALQKSVSDPEVRQRLEAMGISAVSADLARPEALRAHLKNEIDTLGGLLIKAGVKAN